MDKTRNPGKMGDSDGNKRPNPTVTLSDDSDGGSEKKKTKFVDVKTWLMNEEFQVTWIKSRAVNEFLSDIKSHAYETSIKNFNTKLNDSNRLKSNLPDNTNISARLIESNNEIFLRIDFRCVQIAKSRCAHFYCILHGEYSQSVDVNTIERNKCSTCTLRDENDNIIVMSEYELGAPSKSADKVSNASCDTSANMDTEQEDNNPFFAELTNNNTQRRWLSCIYACGDV